MAKAWLTRSPLTAFVTRRTLRGEMPTPLAIALTCIVASPVRSADRSGLLTLATRMTTEVPCGGELTQLVTHHVLLNVDRHMGLAIMNSNGHAYHVGEDSRGTRPGFDHAAVPAAPHGEYFFLEGLMDVWPLFS